MATDNEATTCYSLAAVFLVDNVGATARWYRDVLGFRFTAFPQEEPFEWASLVNGGAEIMLQRAPGYRKPDLDPLRPGGVWNAYLYATGVDALHERIKDRVTVRRAPCDQPYRLRELEIADPDGYVLAFGEQIDAA
jgi:catechol 2,3-dioxygenase-like lactoylglutathione lyase family enzyme